MPSKERQWLIKSINAMLLPSLRQHGFEVVPLSDEDARSSDIRTAFPFGRLRRMSQRGFDLVEIQLDKRGGAEFRLNVGIAPPDGIEHFISGHVAQEDIWVGYLDQSYEVYKCPRLWMWFRVFHWPGRAVTKSNFDELVASVVELIPEVELALRDGKCGPHVRQIK